MTQEISLWYGVAALLYTPLQDLQVSPQPITGIPEELITALVLGPVQCLEQLLGGCEALAVRPAQEHEQSTERPEFPIEQAAKTREVFLLQQCEGCHQDLLEEVLAIAQAIEIGQFPGLGWVRMGEQC